MNKENMGTRTMVTPLDTPGDTNENSSGPLDYVLRVVQRRTGKSGFSIFLRIAFVVPLAMIVIGAVYLRDCKAERNIPIYLIVGGCFGVLRVCIALLRQYKADEDENERYCTFARVGGVLDCFLIAWLVAGSLWTYTIKDSVSHDKSAAGNFCDPVLYWFSFGITTAVYVIASCCVCLCCFGGVFSYMYIDRE